MIEEDDDDRGDKFVGDEEEAQALLHLLRAKPEAAPRPAIREVRRKSLECQGDTCVKVLQARDYCEAPGWSYKLADQAFALDAPPVTDELHSFNDDELRISFPFAASQGRDRVGDFLEVTGIRTENHRANPVAYVDHGWMRKEFPVGKCESPSGQYGVRIDAERGLAFADVWLSKGLLKARQAYLLYRDRVLRAGSIGYRTIRAEKLPPDPERGLKPGLHLIEVELLEPSLVGMPINQDAVVKALHTPLDGHPLDEDLRRYLERWAPLLKEWANGWAGAKELPALSAVDQSAGGSFVGAQRRARRAVKRKAKP